MMDDHTNDAVRLAYLYKVFQRISPLFEDMTYEEFIIAVDQLILTYEGTHHVQ